MNAIIETIEAAEKALGARVKHLQKFEKLLGVARRDLMKNKRPIVLLKTLVAELTNLPVEPPGPNWVQLKDALSQFQDSLAGSFQKDFLAALRAETEMSNLPFHMSAEQVTVGPFKLSIDAAKGTAGLEYAKVELIRDLPLDGKEIVDQVKHLESTLLVPPSDLGQLAGQLDEAVRVTLARQKRSLHSDEMRAELPAVYRELLFLRQGWTNPVAKRKIADYPLPRFVVDIKTLIQSEQNLSAARRFRLEPAVIENTKNPSKAIFIPSDLSQGAGEGMYYQAIVLLGAR